MASQHERMLAAIQLTWEGVAPDAHWVKDLDDAVELVLDASRVLAYGEDPEAARALELLPTVKRFELARTALKGYF